MSDLSQYVLASAQAHNVDPALINAVIQQESGGNPVAQNPAGGGQGAWGPMQVRAPALADYNAANGTKYTVQDLLKPQVGVDVGSWYLGKQLDQFGDPSKALVAYNQGAASPAVAQGTNPYAQSVLGRLQMPQQQPKMLPGIPTAAPQGQLSDDAIFSAFTKGAAPQSQAPQQGPSDDQILAAFTKSAPANAAPTQPAQGQPAGTPQTRTLADVLGFTKPDITQSILAGAGRGVQEMGLGAQQLIGHGVQSLGDFLQSPAFQHAGAWLAQNATQGMGGGAQEVAPYQAAHPIAAGAGQFAGSALASAPLAIAAPAGTGLLGLAGRGALSGAAMGALTPVSPGAQDFAIEKAKQIGLGALIGGATPGFAAGIGAGARYVGNVASAAVQPFTAEGQQAIAENILARAAKGGPTAADLSQIVPGSSPMLAEATANPGIATLQRTMRDVNPNPFIAQEQQNAAARLSALEGITGTPEDLIAARAGRDTQAASDYLSTHVGIPTSNTDYAALKQTPAFQSAFKQAQTMAKNAGASSIETTVQNRAKANMGGALGSPETYVSGTGLHWIKQALDDQINSAAQAGEKGQAANLLGVKDKLLGLMDQEIPGYAQARGAYAAASKPIDAMQYLQGLNLTNANGDITLAKVQNALSSLQKAQQKPGINLAKSVTQPQIDALTSIRDDLLRAGNAALGKSAGSATAQNLATQNMVQSALPGKLGALVGKLPAGTVGGTVGTGLGYALGGPLGATIGSGAGAFVGRTLGGLANASNEAIQGHLTNMLLNPALGQTALNRTTSTALPIATSPILQRLLYPAVVGGSVRALGPSNGP